MGINLREKLLKTLQAILVPEAGLEPAWVAPHAPQTCVSASSTTPALAINGDDVRGPRDACQYTNSFLGGGCG
jgi:hypothetical protein